MTLNQTKPYDTLSLDEYNNYLALLARIAGDSVYYECQRAGFVWQPHLDRNQMAQVWEGLTDDQRELVCQKCSKTWARDLMFVPLPQIAAALYPIANQVAEAIRKEPSNDC